MVRCILLIVKIEIKRSFFIFLEKVSLSGNQLTRSKKKKKLYLLLKNKSRLNYSPFFIEQAVTFFCFSFLINPYFPRRI